MSFDLVSECRAEDQSGVDRPDRTGGIQQHPSVLWSAQLSDRRAERPIRPCSLAGEVTDEDINIEANGSRERANGPTVVHQISLHEKETLLWKPFLG